MEVNTNQEVRETLTANDGWAKKRKGYSHIYTHPSVDRAIVDNRGFGFDPGISWNGSLYASVEDAKAAALASAPPPAVPDAVGVRVTSAMVTAFYEKTEVTREGSILGIKEGLAAAIALSSIEPTPSPEPQASNAGAEDTRLAALEAVVRKAEDWFGEAWGLLCADNPRPTVRDEKVGKIVLTARCELPGMRRAALSSIDPTPSLEPQATEAYGWLYHNPDTGTEWAPNHPVQSGEVHDAEDVRAATAVALQAELVSAWRALAEEQDLRRSQTVSSSEVEFSNDSMVNTVVNCSELDDLFSRIPSGPYRAIHSEGGWEIRQIDTDPLNKHHWPFRLCQSIAGQVAGCDDATFEFIAAILNVWPTIRIALSTPEPQTGERDALDAAARASYEYEGDRRGIDYLGWDEEPDDRREQWRESVRVAIEAHRAALRAKPEAQAIAPEQKAT